MMSLNCTIPSNPDIAGIGVRASIYFQAVLALIPVFLSATTRFEKDDDLSEEFLDDMKASSTAVLTTGCAILVSSFIQAQLYGLSTYHALIVLNLSWLNNISAFLPANVIATSGALLSIIKVPSLNTGSASPTWSKHLRRTIILPFILHLTATGAFGIWLFARIDEFGIDTECNPFILWAAVGQPIPATSGSLRAFFLTLSTISAIPLVNLIIPFTLQSLLGWLTIYCNRMLGYWVKWLIILFWSVPIILIVIGTEQTVALNAHHVQEGEGDWTFGQTLALLLLFVPLWNVLLHMGVALSHRIRKPASTKECKATGSMDSDDQISLWTQQEAGRENLRD